MIFTACCQEVCDWLYGQGYEHLQDSVITARLLTLIAADWRETLDRLLIWLAPMAHNMIRWQSEHNFEQQQVVARTNILLLQTLYFADVVKTESAITELLVGLNYIAGLEQEMKSNSMMMEQDLHKQQEDSEEYLGWPF
jgi:hypothetical protein